MIKRLLKKVRELLFGKDELGHLTNMWVAMCASNRIMLETGHYSASGQFLIHYMSGKVTDEEWHKNNHLLEAIDVEQFPITSVWLISYLEGNMDKEEYDEYFDLFINLDHQWVTGKIYQHIPLRTIDPEYEDYVEEIRRLIKLGPDIHEVIKK